MYLVAIGSGRANKFGSSEYFMSKDINPEFAQPSVFPAKAGIHSEVIRADSLWIPAFAGKTEILPNLRECVSLPTKKSEQPQVFAAIHFLKALRYALHRVNAVAFLPGNCRASNFARQRARRTIANRAALIVPIRCNVRESMQTIVYQYTCARRIKA